MTEDELLSAITDAMTLAGWRWTHVRRSDQAITQGHAGFPDVFAIHPGRGIIAALELKTDRGSIRPDQAAWLAAFGAVQGAVQDEPGVITALIVRPGDLDTILRFILGAAAVIA